MTPLCVSPLQKKANFILANTNYFLGPTVNSICCTAWANSIPALFFCCIFPENNQRPNNRLELKLFLFCPSKWLPTAIIAIYSLGYIFDLYFLLLQGIFLENLGAKKERETKTCTSQHQLLFFPQSNLRGQKVFLKWTHNEIVTLGGKFRYFTHQHILTI